ncbi:MAG: hypothetical protein LV479_01605 [Methylacidiphilales bacterium]|nr:hypothetical protein [Candidatus Methylacidiphilales bacterium]
MLIALGVALGAMGAKAQSEPVLTGSSIKVEDVVLKSDAIFSGTITQELGPPNLKGIGENYYGVHVHVIKIYLGTVAQDVTVSILVLPRRLNEWAPLQGQTYIFFVKKNAQAASDQFTVLKLLPATDANVTKVKALIAAAPAGK